MEQRPIERLGRTVSCVGFGAWQLGADWGDVSEADATATLEAALEEGVTFVDTADVYGDGRSERIIGGVLAGLGDQRPVATKMGRRLPRCTRTTRRRTSANGSSARARTSAWRRSTSCSCTVRRAR